MEDILTKRLWDYLEKRAISPKRSFSMPCQTIAAFLRLEEETQMRSDIHPTQWVYDLIIKLSEDSEKIADELVMLKHNGSKIFISNDQLPKE